MTTKSIHVMETGNSQRPYTIHTVKLDETQITFLDTLYRRIEFYTFSTGLGKDMWKPHCVTQ